MHPLRFHVKCSADCKLQNYDVYYLRVWTNAIAFVLIHVLVLNSLNINNILIANPVTKTRYKFDDKLITHKLQILIPPLNVSR